MDRNEAPCRSRTEQLEIAEQKAVLALGRYFKQHLEWKNEDSVRDQLLSQAVHVHMEHCIARQTEHPKAFYNHFAYLEMILSSCGLSNTTSNMIAKWIVKPIKDLLLQEVIARRQLETQEPVDVLIQRIAEDTKRKAMPEQA